MTGWIGYSLATAGLISIEYILVKLVCNKVPGMDMTTFVWQARVVSATLLTMAVLWKLNNSKKDEDDDRSFRSSIDSPSKDPLESISMTTWLYAFGVGLVSSLSILAFYLALQMTANPGYPTAVKEVSLILTFLLGAVFLGHNLRDVHRNVWIGLGLLGIGVFMIAKYGGSSDSALADGRSCDGCGEYGYIGGEV